MSDSSAPAPRGGKLILVVDGDEAARTSLCRTLRSSGYAAVPARDAAEAQWCAGHVAPRPDLVLVDTTHPEGDAYHFGAALSSLRPYVPVIAMADYAREEGVRRGVIDLQMPFLQKPVCPSMLVRTVGSVLSRWKGRPLA